MIAVYFKRRTVREAVEQLMAGAVITETQEGRRHARNRLDVYLYLGENVYGNRPSHVGKRTLHKWHSLPLIARN